MTLVAAIQPRGIPILFGDFLITSQGERFSLTKKAHLISPYLVIGWTGHRWAAKPILKDIYEAFDGRPVTKQQLKGFLTSYPVRDLGTLEVTLIGWIIDQEPYCFLWRSDYSEEVFYNSHYLVGTGAETFQQIAGEGKAPPEAKGSDLEVAIDFTIEWSCRLMGDEILTQDYQKMGFGYAYEILYFDGEAFRYVDNILYIMYTFFFDSQSNITRIVHNRPLYKYVNVDGESIIKTHDLEENRSEIHIILPVHNGQSKLLDTIKDKLQKGEEHVLPSIFELPSKYYCVLFNLIESSNPSTSLKHGALTSRSDTPNAPFTIKRVDDWWDISINTGVIEWIYRTLKLR